MIEPEGEAIEPEEEVIEPEEVRGGPPEETVTGKLLSFLRRLETEAPATLLSWPVEWREPKEDRLRKSASNVFCSTRALSAFALALKSSSSSSDDDEEEDPSLLELESCGLDSSELECSSGIAWKPVSGVV